MIGNEAPLQDLCIENDRSDVAGTLRCPHGSVSVASDIVASCCTTYENNPVCTEDESCLFVTYTEAQARCHQLGMRLCSVQELGLRSTKVRAASRTPTSGLRHLALDSLRRVLRCLLRRHCLLRVRRLLRLARRRPRLVRRLRIRRLLARRRPRLVRRLLIRRHPLRLPLARPSASPSSSAASASASRATVSSGTSAATSAAVAKSSSADSSSAL